MGYPTMQSQKDSTRHDQRRFSGEADSRIKVPRVLPGVESQIEDFIETNNQNTKPFIWTKNVDQILEKVNRCKSTMGTLY